MFDPTTLVGFHTWLSLIALGAGVVDDERFPVVPRARAMVGLTHT